MRVVMAASAVLLALGLWMTDSALAFDLQAHRGGRGLAPENTLAAFSNALALGVTTLELDTAVTRDGVVVVSHDSTLNPDLTRDGQGQWLTARGPAIFSLTLAELQAFDVGRVRPDSRYEQSQPEQKPADGERVPTLAKVFELAARRGDLNVRFNIETKLSPLQPGQTLEPEAFVRAVLDVAARHHLLDRITLQSFDWRTLQVAQRLAPKVPTVYLSSRQAALDNVADPRWTAGLRLADHDGSVPRMVKAAGGATWSPYHGDVTQDAMQQAHALGLKVVAWTVNEPARIEQMLDLGVDGLISDRPDRVRSAMAARGMPLPRPTPP